MRQHLPHRLVRVERRVAGGLVGDAGAVERLDQQAALRAQPVEHREIGEGARRGRRLAAGAARIQREVAGAAHHLLDLVDDVLRLGLVGGRAVDVELDLIREVRQDLERLAVGVPGDDLRGRVEDHLRRTIVVAEVQRHRAGVVLLELEEIAPVGPAEAVDRLVGIADDAEIRAAGCQQPQQAILGLVHILVFVHRDPAIARLDGRQHVGMRFEEADGQQDQVVEVDGVARTEGGGVAFVDVRRVCG